jgi:2-(1,2-epoxy-1,2-dihydrophenyl)acetyl-CoA isomerase
MFGRLKRQGRRYLGRARAQAMMTLAARSPVEKARDWGLIYEVVDDESLAEHTTELAQACRWATHS